MRINKEHGHAPAGSRRFTTIAICILLGVALTGVTLVAGQVSDRRVTNEHPAKREMREWAEKHFPHLVKPDFARLELARMLPELNDGPERLKAPFKVGGAVNFRLLVTNGSTERIYFPIASPYEHNRPRLFKGNELVPYRQDIQELVRGDVTQLGYRSIKYDQVEPGQTFTEVIQLNDWYEPLQPGAYRLVVRHRFILEGEWVDSPPINFEVIP